MEKKKYFFRILQMLNSFKAARKNNVNKPNYSCVSRNLWMQFSGVSIFLSSLFKPKYFVQFYTNQICGRSFSSCFYTLCFFFFISFSFVHIWYRKCRFRVELLKARFQISRSPKWEKLFFLFFRLTYIVVCVYVCVWGGEGERMCVTS